MKTNNEKAQVYGYYTANNVPRDVMANEYFAQKWEDTKRRCNAMALPVGLNPERAGVYFKLGKETETSGNVFLFADCVVILVFSDKTDVPMILREYKGKYSLFPVWEWMLRERNSIPSGALRACSADLIEPNRIGVFTERKVNEWIDYCLAVMEREMTCINETLMKVEANKKYMRECVADFEKLGARIWGNVKNGEVWINLTGFSIHLELCEYGTFLSKKVDFLGNVEDVLKMMGGKSNENSI